MDRLIGDAGHPERRGRSRCDVDRGADRDFGEQPPHGVVVERDAALGPIGPSATTVDEDLATEAGIPGWHPPRFSARTIWSGSACEIRPGS
jgi:hypothetical protein